MSQPYIGEVRIWACNFAPRGWAFCNGQLLAIAQNTALFSLVGTTYGGDGRTTFGLPDLQDRAAMHPGNGPGLTSRRLGQKGGTTTETLTLAQIGSHTHGMQASPSPGEQTGANVPAGSVNALSRAVGGSIYGPTTPTASLVNMANGAQPNAMLLNTGGGGPHDNRQPYLALNFCIALTGVYPSRS